MLNLNNLFKLLEERGKSKYLSEKTGISTGNISDWKSGRSVPSADALVKISKTFNCSVDYLLGLTDVENIYVESSDVISIPIMNQKAAAGLGKETNDLSDIEYEARWFPSEKIPVGTQYGIIIEGDSMETKFHDGQIVFVKLTDDCNDGEYGIFNITESDVTKVYFKQKKMLSNYTYKLHSLNPNSPDITDFNNKTCRCIAVALM